MLIFLPIVPNTSTMITFPAIAPQYPPNKAENNEVVIFVVIDVKITTYPTIATGDDIVKKNIFGKTEKLNFKDKTMIINDDALHFSLGEILQMYQDNNKDNYHNLTKKLTIISNLPYNIGTTLVMNWIEQTDEIEEIVVMLQKEVVDRCCAKQSTKDYGKISVLTQSVCNTKKLFDVSQKCFIPMPKVISSVIKITPKENKISKEEYQKLNSFCKVAFSQRRKKLIKILKNSKEYKHIIPDNNIIINNNRADEISIENYLKLLKYL